MPAGALRRDVGVTQAGKGQGTLFGAFLTGVMAQVGMKERRKPLSLVLSLPKLASCFLSCLVMRWTCF